MRQVPWCVVLMCISLSVSSAYGQTSSLDVLEKDLQQIKNQHQELTAQALANFLSQLDAASHSPEAAIDLYQKASGAMPAPAPVNKRNVVETPSEKAVREAIDQSNLTAIGCVAQLHCGLMSNAALFVVKPNQPGLNDGWIAWLKSAAQIYPQLADAVDPATGGGGNGGNGGGEGKRHGGQGGGKRDNPTTALKNMTMRDSPIGKYLGFRNWGDKEQGNWAVRELPNLYRTAVLEPLRTKPSQETLKAWDVYIAMKNADQPDTDRWTSVEYPQLSFDRACDEYAITPTMDKLNAAVQIIRANPTHPKLDDMIAKAHDLLDDYRKGHPSAAAIQAVAPPPPDPNVTTVTEGDMTIITKRSTNAPADTPPAPTPAP